ncbi:MAG: hypothetical protein U1E17_04855 [Geminicoccaceae bacterium]
MAALTVAPWVRRLGEALGFATSAQARAQASCSALMILPFVSSLVGDAHGAVPQQRCATARWRWAPPVPRRSARILVPATMYPASPAAFLLAISRAVSETMIVVMAAGLATSLTASRWPQYLHHRADRDPARRRPGVRRRRRWRPSPSAPSCSPPRSCSTSWPCG